ncbi:interferon-induced transmembrane protein [Elysia marginata]|uniref:Interferon-induced transmembrane protein n=1 Tax=Elysia marginata TaxID=1093978 RepID=A0AAV4IR49_9GAST|nr:interferon-induced transmembrane protein [Elysia marginata]
MHIAPTKIKVPKSNHAGDNLYSRLPQTQTVVVAPQQVVMAREGEHVEDNMVIAIISIFFCCILGLVATFKANSAKNLKTQPGGLEQAKRDANSAKKLAIAAIITGCVIIFLTIFVTFILPLILTGVFASQTY